MARRSAKGNGLEGLLLIAFFVVIFIIIPAVLTLAAYGSFAFIVVGLALCEFKARERPTITKAAEFYSADEETALNALRFALEKLYRQKAELYANGDQFGLSRRSLDPTRFDERKVQAKRLNAKLVKLDKEFAEAESQLRRLKGAVQERYESWSEQFARWRLFVSGRAAFRIALISYLIIVLGLATVKPMWSDNFSRLIAGHVWFATPKLSDVYGPLIIASMVCSGIVALAWSIGRQKVQLDLQDHHGFLEQWVRHQEHSTDDFVSSYWMTDEDETGEYEEEQEFADGNPDWDGHAAGQRSCFEILGVCPTASIDEIKTAYREKIKQYHPDRVASLGPKLKEVADRETKVLNAAYEEALRRV